MGTKRKFNLIIEIGLKETLTLASPYVQIQNIVAEFISEKLSICPGDICSTVYE